MHRQRWLIKYEMVERQYLEAKKQRAVILYKIKCTIMASVSNDWRSANTAKYQCILH